MQVGSNGLRVDVHQGKPAAKVCSRRQWLGLVGIARRKSGHWDSVAGMRKSERLASLNQRGWAIVPRTCARAHILTVQGMGFGF